MQGGKGLRGYAWLLGFMIVLFLGLSSARAWAIPEPEGLDQEALAEFEGPTGWRLVLHLPQGEAQEFWLAEVFADSSGYEWNLGQPYLPLRLLAEAYGRPLEWREYSLGWLHAGAAVWQGPENCLLLLPDKQQLIAVDSRGAAAVRQEYAAPALLADTLCLPLQLLPPLGLEFQLNAEQRSVEVWPADNVSEDGGSGNKLDLAAAWEAAQPALADIWREELGGELLAAAETEFDPSLANRSHNLYLAAEALHGLELAAGEEFSFNQAVGPRTAARGYRSAVIFVNRQPALGLGGGICQVSSTLYMALCQTDLPVLERHSHSLAVDYAPAGADATVAWGAKDLRWRNSLAEPVHLRCQISGGRLRAEVWLGPAPSWLPPLLKLE